MPARAAADSERVAIGRGPGEGGGEIDAGEAVERLGDGLRRRFGERIGRAAAPEEALGRDRACRLGEDRGAVGHDGAVRLRRRDTIRAW